MVDYVVTAQIRLEVEATNEDDAKDVALEQLGDFLRHNSFARFMKAKSRLRTRLKSE